MLTRDDLHDYQEACVGFQAANPRCGLLLDMGCGKTVSALTAIVDHGEPTLVVAPKRVAEHVWAQEARKWAHLSHLNVVVLSGTARQRTRGATTPADVHVISRDNLAWLLGLYEGLELPWRSLVVDESSSFKNPKSKRFKALRKRLKDFDRRVILTGTPAPNGIPDLWSQAFILDHGARLGRTVGQFRAEFLSPALARGHVVYKWRPKPGASAEIENRLGDICAQLKAGAVLGKLMPEVVESDVPCPLPAHARDTYERLRKAGIAEVAGSEVNAMTAAAVVNKLLQVCGGHVYDDEGAAHRIHSEKLDALREMWDEGDSLLVCYAYLPEREALLEAFPHALTLDDPGVVDRWNAADDQQMLIMHPASGGHGLNLQRGGSAVVWYGLTWNLELYQQANARLARQGQRDKVVSVRRLVCPGTVEDRVAAALRDKAHTQEALVRAFESLA